MTYGRVEDWCTRVGLRLRDYFHGKRIKNRVRAVVEWRAHMPWIEMTDAELERLIYDDNIAFRERS